MVIVVVAAAVVVVSVAATAAADRLGASRRLTCILEIDVKLEFVERVVTYNCETRRIDRFATCRRSDGVLPLLRSRAGDERRASQMRLLSACSRPLRLWLLGCIGGVLAALALYVARQHGDFALPAASLWRATNGDGGGGNLAAAFTLSSPKTAAAAADETTRTTETSPASKRFLLIGLRVYSFENRRSNVRHF